MTGPERTVGGRLPGLQKVKRVKILAGKPGLRVGSLTETCLVVEGDHGKPDVGLQAHSLGGPSPGRHERLRPPRMPIAAASSLAPARARGRRLAEYGGRSWALSTRLNSAPCDASGNQHRLYSIPAADVSGDLWGHTTGEIPSGVTSDTTGFLRGSIRVDDVQESAVELAACCYCGRDAPDRFRHWSQSMKFMTASHWRPYLRSMRETTCIPRRERRRRQTGRLCPSPQIRRLRPGRRQQLELQPPVQAELA